MKMAMKDGRLYIKEADNSQFMIIKSWNRMKWSKKDQMLHGPATLELLDLLAGIVRLPPAIEAERLRRHEIAEAVDRERMNEHPVPFVKYPVKANPFLHQTRAANMALLTFGFVTPEEAEDPSRIPAD